jgi:ATP-dependent Clp protease protease subunit
MNPIFYEKTKDGEVMYDIPSRLIKDRVIFLDSEITSEVASMIAALLFMLDREDKDQNIDLWINSPGGSLEGLFAIYDMMHRIQAPVRTVCIGEASSAAAIILAAGSPGERYAMPNSKVMIHQIQVDGMGGTATEVEISDKELKQLSHNLNCMLARHTGQYLSKIRRDIIHDKFLTAQEALDYGIVDKIMPYVKEIPKLKIRKNK